MYDLDGRLKEMAPSSCCAEFPMRSHPTVPSGVFIDASVLVAKYSRLSILTFNEQL